MKKSLLLLVGLLVVLIAPLGVDARSYRSSPSDVHVNGYYRSNGTYVAPYYRSAPDSSILNNYSCIDDGRCGGSGSGSNNPTYVAPITPPKTQQCPSNSSLVGTTCYCDTGYNVSTDGKSCVFSTNAWCIQKYGIRSYYNNNEKVCYCGIGDVYNASTDSCVAGRPQQTPTETKMEAQPQTSFCAGGTINSSGLCICGAGFGWNDFMKNCIGLAPSPSPSQEEYRDIQEGLIIKVVVTSRRVNVRTLPSTKGNVVGVTRIGGSYKLLKTGNSWVKIQFGTLTGWVLKNLVTIK